MRKDGVTPELRERILKRDGRCFLSRMYPDHQCRDQWGAFHAATDTARLSLDHVHDGGGMVGKRAPSDERHLVAMCAYFNIAGPSREVRQAERVYLGIVDDRTD